MAIYLNKGPSAGEELVRHHLNKRKESLRHLRWSGGEMPIGQAHYVYTATRDDLLHGRFLQAARPTAWLYVVGSHRNPQALVEVSCANRHGPAPLEYATLHPGNLAADLLQALAAAEALKEVRGEHYELRILRAPSLSLLAVWLHGGEAMLLPVRASKGVMDRFAGRPYMRPFEIEQMLLPLAHQRLVASDRG